VGNDRITSSAAHHTLVVWHSLMLDWVVMPCLAVQCCIACCVLLGQHVPACYFHKTADTTAIVGKLLEVCAWKQLVQAQVCLQHCQAAGCLLLLCSTWLCLWSAPARLPWRGVLSNCWLIDSRAQQPSFQHARVLMRPFVYWFAGCSTAAMRQCLHCHMTT
jgi:hypothetical protein